MAYLPVNAHWRDSARNAKFFIVDAYAAVPLLLFLLHIRLWTFGLAVLATAFFGILERFGFTVPIFLRWLRTFLGGSYKFARPWWRHE